MCKHYYILKQLLRFARAVRLNLRVSGDLSSWGATNLRVLSAMKVFTTVLRIFARAEQSCSSSWARLFEKIYGAIENLWFSKAKYKVFELRIIQETGWLCRAKGALNGTFCERGWFPFIANKKSLETNLSSFLNLRVSSDLSSREATLRVLSAMKVFTTVFGMGTGGFLSLCHWQIC